MARPSDPMLEEFRLLAEADLSRPGELDRLADAICDLFTDDCLLEDTSTTDVVRGRAELHDYCKALFGPFSDVRIVPQEILDSGARILFVGIGCPKQEWWMYNHRDRLPLVMLGVGAAFDFHSGRVKQSPAFLQRLGLEWAFRLVMEPKRLWKRYARHNPRFVYLFARQLIRQRLLGRKGALE